MKARTYAFVLLLPLALHAAGFWRFVTREASSSYQLDYGEGIVLYQASKITDVSFAYKAVTEYPFVVFHYPPLYHLAVRAMAAVTGDLLTAGRAVSLLSGALTELVLGLLVYCCLPRRVEFWRRVTSAMFAGLLPTLLVVMMWTSLARVDMLALLLSFAGLSMFVLSGRQQPGQYVALVLMVAALFTKQTAVAAPAACLATALIVDPKQAVRLTAFACVLGSTVLGALSWATDGGVVRHLFLYNQNTFSLERTVRGLAENVLLILPIAALAAVHIWQISRDIFRVPSGRRWCRVRAWLVVSRLRRLGLVASLMLVTAVIVALSYGKTGSSFNYFIEWNLVSCLLAGLALFRSWNARWSPPAALFLAHVVPLVMLLQGLPQGIRSLGPPSPASVARSDSRTAAHATVLNLIRGVNGPVFSEDMLLLLEAGKDVPAEPAIIRELAMSGLWDERPFLRLIAEQRFDLIVTAGLSRRERYTPAAASAIEKSYELTRKVSYFEIYEPRARN